MDVEETLKSKFEKCELIIENLLHNNSRGEVEKLKNCVEDLQEMIKMVDNLSLFSTNDDIEELPTSSIRYLLLPAYLAFTLEEIYETRESRYLYLNAAKIHYRQFLENLLIYQLISFKLDWLNNENLNKTNEIQLSSAERREEKIRRLNQKKNLENKLLELKALENRNADEILQRQILLILIRLWAIRAYESLSILEDELKLLEHWKKVEKNEVVKEEQPPVKNIVKPFIIAKTTEQKKVFGLGYPSLPTYTVDEWYEQMIKNKNFSKFPSTAINKNEESESDSDENLEVKRQKDIQKDEYKDLHRRGWGNTHNKG